MIIITFVQGCLNRSQNEILNKAYQTSIELKLKENKIITLKIINTQKWKKRKRKKKEEYRTFQDFKFFIAKLQITQDSV